MEIFACNGCRRNYVRSKSVCPSCGGTEFRAIQIEDKGTVESYTTIWIAPEKFVDQVPYHVIVVGLDRGLRLTGRLGGPAEGLAIGAPVEFTEKDDTAYWFRLA
jgi:uncharacterized OB-fold protein